MSDLPDMDEMNEQRDSGPAAPPAEPATPPERLASDDVVTEPAAPPAEPPVAVEPQSAVSPPSPPPVPPPAPKQTAKKKKKNEDSLTETIKTIVYALLIALVIRTFLFQPFYIPSGSMEATLLVGDYLFVEKFAYGYSRYSFPFGLAPISGRVFASQPERGDVIVFKMPNVNSPEYGEDFIKRCIGLPGDRIQIINGQIYLNDKPVPRARVGDYVETDESGIETHVARYRETLPNGKSYLVLARHPDYPVNNMGPFVVPSGHYFMMGDNRDDSDDSRLDVGYVPADKLVGKAVFIFFSIDGSLGEVWRWPWEIRYHRLFTAID